MCPTSPFNSAQCPGPEEQPSQAHGTALTPITFVHHLMMPQFNAFYWPYFLNLYPMQIPFAHFPIGPHLQVCPYHVAAWYSFQQQSMMGTYLYAQPMHFGVPPSATSQGAIALSTVANTSPATLITNSTVTFNEIGDDNSTNLKIQKNRHHNTGSD